MITKRHIRIVAKHVLTILTIKESHFAKKTFHVTARKMKSFLITLHVSILLTLNALSANAITCLAAGSTEVTINNLFTKGGVGTIVRLCPSTSYTINGTIYFTAANQELSTNGYVTGAKRATILLGPGNDVSTLISGNWLDGIKLKNVIVDGARPTNGYVGGVLLLNLLDGFSVHVMNSS